MLLQGVWDCGICLEQLPGTQCVQASLDCAHVFCRQARQLVSARDALLCRRPAFPAVKQADIVCHAAALLLLLHIAGDMFHSQAVHSCFFARATAVAS